MPSSSSFSRSLGFLTGIFVLACTLAVGQVNNATVYGNVTDPSGAVIAGAQIEAKNTLTGVALQTTSNGEGRFTFNFLPIGTYTFSVQAPGFQGLVRNQVQLSAADTIELTFKLEVSASQQSVTIEEQAPVLSTERAEQHVTVDTRRVHELPLAREDWTSLLQIGNGITKAGNGGVALNGLAPGTFNLTVDGTNASSDPETPSLGAYQGFNIINNVNTEAIAEVSTTKGIAPASVAGSMSGNVNIITKSGTNQFHGSLLEVNGLSAYGARNQFLSTKPRSTLNQFGGALGGYILKDKLFFFGDYQVVRLSSFTSVSDVVPTPEFVAQTLAAAPQYASVFSVYPKPNQPYAAGAQTAQYVGAGALRQNDGNSVVRFDYYLSPKNILTVRDTRSRPFKEQPRVVSINNRVTSGHNDAYNAQFTHSEPTWTFVSRFGYNRIYLNRLDQGFGAGLPQVKFGFDTVGAETYVKQGGIYTFEQVAAKNIGRHSLQFGGILQKWNSGRIDNTTNTYSFSTLSDFLADIPNSIDINFPLTPFLLHMYQFGGFVQDDFRVSPRLTLNLGLRYDYFTVPKERDGRIFNRLPNQLGPGFGDFVAPSHMYDADWPNFAPRIGFAYSMSKTVLRGGSGMFFSPHTIYGGPIEAPLTASNVPFRLTLNRAQALAMGLKFPINTAAFQAAIIAAGNPIANTSISQNFPNPYSGQWNIGIQREVLKNMVLDVSYVGNRALHLNMVRQENLPDRITGVAPNPRFGSFRYYDGSDSSWYNSLQVALEKRYSSGLTFGVNYTYASNISYGDGDLELNAVPQDNNNIRAERGRTPYAIRNNFNANFVYEAPVSRWTGVNSRAGKLLVDGWQIAGLFVARSGLPANITNSKSSYPLSRPDLAYGINAYADNYTSTLQFLNPAAFIAVPIAPASGASIRPGNLGRYVITAPGLWNLDASLTKNFALSDRFRFQLRAETFNTFNHTNLSGLTTDISKSTFGRLTTATPRTMQLVGKFSF